MTAILLDTHAWAWSIGEEWKLSPLAAQTLEASSVVHVSPVSLFAIAQKVLLGEWPVMEPLVPRLLAVLRDQGGLVAPLTAEIALHAGARKWPHRDPFDRLLASTAELMGLALVTRDPVFSGLAGLRILW